jgi:fructan beta-fructosidase
MTRSRQIAVQHRYLHLPVKNGATMRHLRLLVDGRLVRGLDIELALGEPDFWVFTDLVPFQGQTLTIEAADDTLPAEALDAITQQDALPSADTLYREAYRPQFHFTSRRGWNNDPNGLMYYQGEYHLFYQHNPYGWKWGNMHWGHAISPDLVHWRELGDAIFPDQLGTIFSGSGVVDHENTAGWQTGDEQTLVCLYTSAGDTSVESKGQPFTQSIAYSTDRGRTFTPYAGNPVVAHIAGSNRDPKVIWHAPTRRWVMALYLDENDYALLASPDLKAWTLLQTLTLPGCSECPDLFELPIDGDPARARWVFWGGNGTYQLGTFDGATFVPEGQPQRYDWGGDNYAAQTFSDIPAADGRRIQIAWLRVNLPGMPFNQQMSFPCTLTLRSTPEGIRLNSYPVREIETLYDQTYTWQDMTIQPGDNPLAAVQGDLLDIQVEFEPQDATQFGFYVRGIPVFYDGGRLECAGRRAPLTPMDGRVRLRVLVDRASIEAFGNDGLVALPVGVLPSDANHTLELCVRGGSVRVHTLTVHTLRSAWE